MKRGEKGLAMHYKSKVDILYEKILDDIVNGHYKQGDRIVISKLAKDNKVSDIPVREALRRIESEGLVEIVANHGALVTKFDTDDIAQFYLINAVLGAFATRLSADYLGEMDYQELTRINEELKRAIDADDYERYLLLDESFHLRIFVAVPFPMIYKSINKSWMRRIEKQVKVPHEQQTAAYELHKKIIELSKEKQYEELEKITREHIIAPVEPILNEMKTKMMN
ncbi:MAG: GntR family transcriptional regulator [Anaerofustis sp.]